MHTNSEIAAAKRTLEKHHYCPIHLIKNRVELLRSGPLYACDRCEGEKEIIKLNEINEAIKVLKESRGN